VLTPSLPDLWPDHVHREQQQPGMNKRTTRFPGKGREKQRKTELFLRYFNREIFPGTRMVSHNE
jgi:hypothetical protein